MEKVRLVVWDLDETFWQGTLSEGGMAYCSAHHDLVIALARRGIISSICSRNDHAEIEAILRQTGLWDYFVFPSIDWTAKGPRLAAMMEAVQLRPATVLFIDDNPINRAEACHFVEGLQVADPSIISDMLDSPLFQGKNDAQLTRLAQYKLLERRAGDMRVSSGAAAFLRESDVRVFIDHDVEANIDRAIELINRTNQLNFTKLRLPQEPDAARQELRELIRQYDMQTALVRVKDRYGDYGYTGFYVHSKTVHSDPKLVHYCFSCRIMGMGVESWLYQRLGRPRIQVLGDVLTDLQAPGGPIDWIRIDAGGDAAPARRAADISRIFMRGGCELAPLGHYFGLLTDEVVEELAFGRNGVSIRRDHSQMLRLAIEGPSQEQMTALDRLGYRSSDFASSFLDSDHQPDVYILSFWADLYFPLVRHRRLGHRVPFYVANFIEGSIDPTQFDLAHLRPDLKDHWVATAIAEIQGNYVFDGLIDAKSFTDNVAFILDRLPSDARIFLLGMNEQFVQADGQLHDFPPAIEFNRMLRQIVSASPNAALLDIEKHIIDVGDRDAQDPNHFSRKVYFRLYEDIKYRLSLDRTNFAGELEPLVGDVL